MILSLQVFKLSLRRSCDLCSTMTWCRANGGLAPDILRTGITLIFKCHGVLDILSLEYGC